MLLLYEDFIEYEKLNEIRYLLKNLMSLKKNINKHTKEELADLDDKKDLLTRKIKSISGNEQRAEKQREEIRNRMKEIEKLADIVKKNDRAKLMDAMKKQKIAKQQLIDDPKKFWHG